MRLFIGQVSVLGQQNRQQGAILDDYYARRLRAEARPRREEAQDMEEELGHWGPVGRGEASRSLTLRRVNGSASGEYLAREHYS